MPVAASDRGEVRGAASPRGVAGTVNATASAATAARRQAERAASTLERYGPRPAARRHVALLARLRPAPAAAQRRRRSPRPVARSHRRRARPVVPAGLPRRRRRAPPRFGSPTGGSTGTAIAARSSSNAPSSPAVEQVFAPPLCRAVPDPAHGAGRGLRRQATTARWRPTTPRRSTAATPSRPARSAGRCTPTARRSTSTRSRIRTCSTDGLPPPAGRTSTAPTPPGMAEPGGELVEAFAASGWQWGGRWTASPDYQHFSSTAADSSRATCARFGCDLESRLRRVGRVPRTREADETSRRYGARVASSQLGWESRAAAAAADETGCKAEATAWHTGARAPAWRRSMLAALNGMSIIFATDGSLVLLSPGHPRLRGSRRSPHARQLLGAVQASGRPAVRDLAPARARRVQDARAGGRLVGRRRSSGRGASTRSIRCPARRSLLDGPESADDAARALNAYTD